MAVLLWLNISFLSKLFPQFHITFPTTSNIFRQPYRYVGSVSNSTAFGIVMAAPGTAGPCRPTPPGPLRPLPPLAPRQPQYFRFCAPCPTVGRAGARVSPPPFAPLAPSPPPSVPPFLPLALPASRCALLCLFLLQAPSSAASTWRIPHLAPAAPSLSTPFLRSSYSPLARRLALISETRTPLRRPRSLYPANCRAPTPATSHCASFGVECEGRLVSQRKRNYRMYFPA